MRWTTKSKPEKQKLQALQNALQIDEIIASLLIQRGINTYEEARQFFRPNLEDLHDPYLMKDMDKAVKRIETAFQNQENILVFGDYDVDGTTSVSLMSSYLKTITQNIATYIPDRYDEGYGISYKGIDFADDNGFSLIIALDCGIKSIEHINYAKEKNIDFIICDHHRPGNEIPDAVAVLDPKQEDCNYPYKELCGCGVGFKLIQALAQKQNQTIEDLTPYLDLVATAIAADIVPITGENRILAKFGLDVINSNPRPGIKALIQNVKKQKLSITDVVFIIAPRINAAGRIKHGNYAVELLTEFDLEQASTFAAQIESFNVDRKDLDKQITQEALLQIQTNDENDKFTTVVYQEDWHKGVIGIVASRLIETHYRPTIVFTKSGDKLAASARSVKDFDIYNALEASSEFLEQFGGHMYAAGMTLKEENYLAFKDRFEEIVQQTIHPDLLTPEISIDMEIDLDQIDEKLIRILKQFEPHGPENMSPVFITKGLNDTGYGKSIGKEEEHLRLYVKQENSNGFGAIGFGLAKKKTATEGHRKFDAVYSIEENEWNGNTSIQLRLRDIK
ncbi:single-stranded-DNA-specific exonuclease RecJ [Flavobacterium amniphilum]|uniref:single-stranded-DNA-specific exonuclease RecJ n=1 Tax=Flavobacterium amniphilum TaxID=1834035 RepID=UPI002029D920|nr:single-stranded-DNA-specific exonuclease RecJ [Flavobacterium amniphilum]MCL9805805.1 single-stranded-DNA-specific exonuclease RecJ [Flavobacterium amniphilum]MCL9806392.1 single-stranded-DNA-specific exonuclease RecJ [Flavobacterium amniphilum]